MTLFNAISVRHPLVTIQISRIIASRVRESLDQRSSIPKMISGGGASEMGKNNFNLKVSPAFLPPRSQTDEGENRRSRSSLSIDSSPSPNSQRSSSTPSKRLVHLRPTSIKRPLCKS